MNPLRIDNDPQVLDLVQEAATWGLLASLFERPRPGWLHDLRARAAEVGDALLARAADEAAEADEGVYLALFGPGGPTSPREVGHAGGRDPGQVLSELGGIYQAFGFTPRTEEPCDHVAVEAAFAGFLCLKEAYAIAASDARGREMARTARTAFIETHLAGLGQGLSARIPQAAPAYLRLAGESLQQRLGHVALPPAVWTPTTVPTTGDWPEPGCPGTA